MLDTRVLRIEDAGSVLPLDRAMRRLAQMTFMNQISGTARIKSSILYKYSYKVLIFRIEVSNLLKVLVPFQGGARKVRDRRGGPGALAFWQNEPKRGHTSKRLALGAIPMCLRHIRKSGSDVNKALVEAIYSTLAPRRKSASICSRVPPPNRAR